MTTVHYDKSYSSQWPIASQRRLKHQTALSLPTPTKYNAEKIDVMKGVKFVLDINTL